MSENGGHESSFLLFDENQSWGLSNSGGGRSTDEKPAGKEETSLHDGVDDETKKKISNKRGRGGSEHEVHILTERERRKKMRTMFSDLHALLPQLSPKADKSTIVDEAVNHIKSLEQTVEELEKKKAEKLGSGGNINLKNGDQMNQNQGLDSSREAFLADQVSSSKQQQQQLIPSFSNNNSLFQTWTSPNVVLNLCGVEAQISVCSPTNKPGMFTIICDILEKYKVEVTSAHVSSGSNHRMFMIQAHASEACNNQLPNAPKAEEIFKQVAAEMMLWVSS